MHLRPDLAGVVIFISIAWDAVTDPILYPMTRKTYDLLTEQLKNKREGKPVDTKGLEKPGKF